MSYELERKHLLTEEEINNLITIINSDLSDFEKAKQLRAVCKGAVLLNNINKYETTDFIYHGCSVHLVSYSVPVQIYHHLY